MAASSYLVVSTRPATRSQLGVIRRLAARSCVLELPSSDGVPTFSARDAIVCVLEHLRVAREKPAPRRRANAALDLHYTYRIVRQAAKESGERSGSKVTAALTFAVELCFPAGLDVDYRQGVV